MILYVVHGNTYYNDYGHIEKIFGVYTEKDAAEAAKDLVTQELYEKNVNDKWTRVENLSDQSITEKRFTRPFPWIKEDDVYCNNCEHFHDCLNKGGLVDVTTGNDITKDRYINKPGYDCPKGEEHE